MELEILVANLVGKVRREKRYGRDYYVAPLSMIVPGVLNGSKGPYLYPEDEIKKNPGDWNHIPIVAGHPQVNGTYVSARDPEVLEKYGMGEVFRSVHNGKLVAEGWFDIERTKIVEPRILSALEANKPIELSTGLNSDRDETAGTFNGVSYKGIARNYRPDHLAVLVDNEGACSLRDGCGVLVNEDQQNKLFSSFKNFFGDWLKLANNVTTNSKKEEDMSGKLSDADKKAIVDNLIGNCDCAKKEPAVNKGPWTEADRPALNALPDDVLTKMELARKETVANAKLVDTATKGFEHGDRKFVLNAASGTFEAKPKEEPKPEPKAPAVNELSEAEFLKMAPPRIRAMLTNAAEADTRERATLVKTITDNPRNAFSKETLEKMETSDLRNLSALAGGEEGTPQSQSSSSSWAGAAAPFAANVGNRQQFANEDSDMAPPIINWAEKKEEAAA